MKLGARLTRTVGSQEPPAPSAGVSEALREHHPERLGVTGPALSDALASYDATRAQMERWYDPSITDWPPLEAVIDGAEHHGEHGSCYRSVMTFPLASRHGDRSLADFFDRPLDQLAALTGDPRLADFTPNDALFLDIEATGLDHGAGNYAFLIGLGYRQGADFVVEQLILRDPDDEDAQLEALCALLDEKPYLVSFNGKSYDTSVLQQRLVMRRFLSRTEADVKLMPHLDLLHLSNNILGGLYPNCRLQTLERHALGFVRHDDMPGYLAASCWYAYLRLNNPVPLAEIARHNLFDVLSMLTLADRLLDETAPTIDSGRHPCVAVNLAHLWLRRGEPQLALDVLDAMPTSDPSIPMHALMPSQRQRALKTEALAARRLRRHARRRAANEALVSLVPEEATFWVDLSIACDRLRDHSAAYDAAVRAAELSPLPPNIRRRDRFARRLGSSSGPAPEQDKKRA